MKKSFKKVISLLLTFLILIIPVTPVYAQDSVHPDSPTRHIIEGEIPYNQQTDTMEPRYLPQYTYEWRAVSSRRLYQTSNPWRTGPTGYGPGTLSLSNSESIDLSFTASVTAGTPKVSNAEFSGLLGFTVGKSRTYSVNYTISLGSGERKTIIYRPKIQVYEVRQDYLRVNNYTGERTILDTKYCDISEFVDWDYSWRLGY